MRLKCIEEALPAPARWALARALGELPAPMLMFLYRREFLMAHVARHFRLKGAFCAHWPRGEFEAFIAFVSRLNECHF